jgi:hypothetical protein
MTTEDGGGGTAGRAGGRGAEPPGGGAASDPGFDAGRILADVASRMQDAAIARGDLETARAMERLLPGHGLHEKLARDRALAAPRDPD